MVGVDKVISYFLIMQGSRASPKDHSKLELLEGAGSVHGLPLVLKWKEQLADCHVCSWRQSHRAQRDGHCACGTERLRMLAVMWDFLHFTLIPKIEQDAQHLRDQTRKWVIQWMKCLPTGLRGVHTVRQASMDRKSWGMTPRVKGWVRSRRTQVWSAPRETVQGFTVDSSVPSFPTTAGRDPRPEKLGVSSERKWRHSCSQETTGIWFPVTFLSRENFLSRGGKK